jgi:hypothetical protein
MTVTYNEPYKSDFARIKGDKRSTYFKLVFDEAKLYKQENSYVLAGHFTALGGVPHYFNNKTINLNLCEIPIYGSEYIIKEKIGDTKEYKDVTVQPSINERTLYAYLEGNAHLYIQDGKSLKGEIAFYPDDSLVGMVDEQARTAYVLSFTKLEVIEATGKCGEWTPPKAYRNNGNGYGGKAFVGEEKLAFLKKELSLTIFDSAYKENIDKLPLSAFIEKIMMENQGKDAFLGVYFDLLKGVIS